ncbi:hypothetical protein ACFQU2_10085 [Siccirubricoccus deserti]
MTRRPRVWMRMPEKPAPVRPPEAEKQAITRACEAFIAVVLIPRFLPEIKPSPHGSIILSGCAAPGTAAPIASSSAGGPAASMARSRNSTAPSPG